MRPTTWRTLLAPAVLAGVLGWFFARMLENRRGEVGVSAVVGGACAHCCGYRAHLHAPGTPGLGSTVGRGRSRCRPWSPRVSRLWGSPALGPAHSSAGAYLGYTAYVATDLSTDFRQGVLIAWLALCRWRGASLVVGSLLLERTLRLPEPTPDEDERRDFAG